MNKLFIFCTLLLSLIQAAQLSAQATNFNLLMGTGNDNSHGRYNTSYGFIQGLGGDPPAFPAPFTGGTANTFIGANTGNYNTGSNNTTLGYSAGGFFLKGNNNVFIGNGASATPSSFNDNPDGTKKGSTVTGNSFLGYQAGYNNQTDYNVFVGYEAGYSNVSGTNNVFLGSHTGYANTEGSGNTFLGYQVGQTNTTGSNNTFMGWMSGQANTTGSLNTFVGNYTGYSSTTGQYNTFLGHATGLYNTSGVVNTFIGSYAGFSNTTGKQNSFLGVSAGVATTTGSNNTFVGYLAGQNVTTGSNNIIIGPSSGTAITDGNDNVLMGYNSQAGEGIFNGIAIGSQSRVAISNALILGHRVNVGIGTSAPQRKLEVVADEADQSGLRLSELTSHSPSNQLSDEFLTVNEAGDVVKARYQLRIKSAREWSDQVFSPTYRLRPLSSVSAYIARHGHLPHVPPADQVVKQGVDLVRMNAILLEKVEELTLYSIEQQRELDELKRLVKQLLEKKPTIALLEAVTERLPLKSRRVLTSKNVQ